MTSHDARVRKMLTKRSKSGELACARAFGAAEELGVLPATVGRYADEMGLHLVKCQLGLFGYEPEKKIVQPRDSVSPELKAAISDGLADGRLPCAAAWEIADRLGLKKMDVSGACETLDIKIKPCQLGAF
ncbi:MAG: hypothetical protein ACQERN_10380 [Thermodesulfobacteriota bacterium]